MLKEDLKIYKAITNKQKITIWTTQNRWKRKKNYSWKGEPSISEVDPYEYSQSGYTKSTISKSATEINKIIKNKPELKKEIKKILISALLNEEIDEDEHEEALKGIPTLEQQTEEIIMKVQL